MEWRTNELSMTDDPLAVDVDFVERMLRTSYWAPRRERSVIERSLQTSVPLSVFHADRQIGFARIVSDLVTFAWIADVMVDPQYRGRGIGKWMMECIMEHPAVVDTSQQLLRTTDAHDLYAKYGFEIAECMARKAEGADDQTTV
jgi:GNAT superfamily N-acetyltransferase